MSRRRADVTPVLTFIPLLGLAALCIVPLLWLIFAPTKTDAQIVADAPLSFGTLSGYADAWGNLLSFQDGIILRWLWNSVWYSSAIVVGAVIVCLAAGYALATAPVPFRRTILVVTLIGMIVPAAALVLPLFLEISALGLMNSPFAFILPSLFFPFGVYLAFLHFSGNIPPEILNAARIDGAGEWRVLWSVALPLSKSLIGMLAFFSFVASWVNFFLPFLVLNKSEAYPLSLGLQALMANTPALNPAAGGSFIPIHRPEVALAGILAIVPVAIVFLFSQRYLARGILTGSIKD
ncbi:carbohydrate ABC transporter permease [Agromyces soli]|uniref:Carbohydrate ABC transporter permease n=1 Tax=Agromyces soli TaxID=659012 RepID=A0ABY4AWE1_9MICO|nr:carbohydrate ABC transporter permease [Agromyces soli]UOE27169.1 carbohydrate ABC transporter permease [Agromyces soli]